MSMVFLPLQKLHCVSVNMFGASKQFSLLSIILAIILPAIDRSVDNCYYPLHVNSFHCNKFDSKVSYSMNLLYNLCITVTLFRHAPHYEIIMHTS